MLSKKTQNNDNIHKYRNKKVERIDKREREQQDWTERLRYGATHFQQKQTQSNYINLTHARSPREHTLVRMYSYVSKCFFMLSYAMLYIYMYICIYLYAHDTRVLYAYKGATSRDILMCTIRFLSTVHTRAADTPAIPHWTHSLPMCVENVCICVFVLRALRLIYRQ